MSYRKYVFLFLISFLSLSFEILLTRSAFVVFHEGFSALILSFSVFGISIGAYLYEQTNRKIFEKSFLTIESTVFILMTCFYLLTFDFLSRAGSDTSPDIIYIVLLSAAGFFVGSGYGITFLFKSAPRKAFRIYAIDLFAAAAGLLFSLLLLSFFELNTTVKLFFYLVLASTFAFFIFREVEKNQKTSQRFLLVLPLVIFALYFQNNTIECDFNKKMGPSIKTLINPFSTVSLYHGTPENLTRDRSLRFSAEQREDFQDGWLAAIDCRGLTMTSKTKNRSSGEMFRDEFHSAPYFMKTFNNALILGAGLGSDVAKALYFGTKTVTAVEINGDFYQLEKQFLKENSLFGLPNVEAHVDENRRFLANSDKKFDLIYISSNKSFGKLGSGPLSLLVNRSLTLEALQSYWDALNEDGFLYIVDVRYVLRGAFSTGFQFIKNNHINAKQQAFVLRNSSGYMAWMFKKTPFSKIESEHLEQESLRLSWQTNPFSKFRRWKSTAPLITDDRPTLRPDEYFGQYDFSEAGEKRIQKSNAPSFTLFWLVVISIIGGGLSLFLKPILQNTKSASSIFVDQSYFFLSAAAFMALQLAFVKGYGFIFSHPIQSVLICLITMLAGAGLGSILLARQNAKSLTVLTLALIVILELLFLFSPALNQSLYFHNLPIRLGFSVTSIFIISLLAGIFTPRMLSLVGEKHNDLLPGYIAVSGFGSLAGTVFATLIMAKWGISYIYGFTALLYAGVGFILIQRLSKKALQ